MADTLCSPTSTCFLPTNEYDRKGKCVRHPHVRLRKKTILGRFGDWKTVLTNCPDCCALNMKRMATVDKKTKKSKKNKKKEARRKRKEERENAKSTIPSNISAGTESTASNSLSHDESKQKKAISVTKMPYTDAFGDRGWYTGKVNGEGRPHGKGAMKYYDGTYYEGQWINGMSHAALLKKQQLIQEQQRMQEEGHLHAQRQAPPIMNGRRIVVCAMRYIDSNGKSGSYTGQINAATRHPDGKGGLRYDDGSVSEGEWYDGILRQSSRAESKQQQPGFLPAGMCGRGGVKTEGVSIGSLRSMPNFQSRGRNAMFGGNQSLAPGMMRPRYQDDMMYRPRCLEP